MNKNAFGEFMDFPEAFFIIKDFDRVVRNRIFAELYFLSNNARIFLEKSGNECIKFIKCYKNIN